MSSKLTDEEIYNIIDNAMLLTSGIDYSKTQFNVDREEARLIFRHVDKTHSGV